MIKKYCFEATIEVFFVGGITSIVYIQHFLSFIISAKIPFSATACSKLISRLQTFCSVCPGASPSSTEMFLEIERVITLAGRCGNLISGTDKSLRNPESNIAKTRSAVAGPLVSANRFNKSLKSALL